MTDTIPPPTGWPSQGTGDTECADHWWNYSAEFVPISWRIHAVRNDKLENSNHLHDILHAFFFAHEGPFYGSIRDIPIRLNHNMFSLEGEEFRRW